MSEISLNLEDSFDINNIDKDRNNDQLSSVGFKSQVILAMLFGGFGIHDFRAGNYSAGFAKLAFTSLVGWAFQPIVIAVNAYSLINLVSGEYQDSDGKFIRQVAHIKPEEISSCKQETALLFAIFTGLVGGHQFYAGKPFKGVAMICTIGGLGLWQAYDVYKIATAQFKDGQGKIVCPDYIKSTVTVQQSPTHS